MDTKKLYEYYNDLDDQGHYDAKHSGHHRAQYHEPVRIPLVERQFRQNQDDGLKSFSTTYKAARFEDGWLLNSLGGFYEQQWIIDVLSKIKSGKEASVYLCRSGDLEGAPLLAAKVYRPRMLRNLKNDQLYRMDRDMLDANGKRILDLGMLKAQRKRSTYGEQIRHQSWIAHEFQSLKTLYAAGADVPEPLEMGENAILMGYIGDEKSSAATLNKINLERVQAGAIFERLVRNIEIMLSHDIVHGDLSAYNVLYWDGNITIIDFPQVISPVKHRSAWKIFRRDILRLCEYFSHQGIKTEGERLATDLWRSHGYRLSRDIAPGSLNDDDPSDHRSLLMDQEAE
jgi:RIO kinase 1